MDIVISVLEVVVLFMVDTDQTSYRMDKPSSQLHVYQDDVPRRQTYQHCIFCIRPAPFGPGKNPLQIQK